MKISTIRIIIFIIGLIVASIILILPFYILHGAEVLQEITKRVWIFILLSLTVWFIWPLLKSGHKKIFLILLIILALLLGFSFYQFIRNYTPTPIFFYDRTFKYDNNTLNNPQK